jgi:hypothetical protein
LVQILRFGLQPLKEAIAGGQYDFPDGLFYGGSEPSRSHQVIAEHCGDWIGASNDIIHIDIHSGLGAHATYKLLLANDIDEEARLWHTNTFGPDVVEFNTTEKRKTAYTIRGEFGQWMRNRFSDRRYRFALAEFGTYNNIRVLQAMRNENRMYHFSDHESIHYRRARAELLECFCPASVSWRNQVVMSGTQICLQAWAAIGR